MVEGIYVYDVMWERVCRARNIKCKGPKAEKLLTLETKRAAETTLAFISCAVTE